MNFGIDVIELSIFSLKHARDNSGKPTVSSFWTRRGLAADSPTQPEFTEAGLRPKKIGSHCCKPIYYLNLKFLGVHQRFDFVYFNWNIAHQVKRFSFFLTN